MVNLNIYSKDKAEILNDQLKLAFYTRQWKWISFYMSYARAKSPYNGEPDTAKQLECQVL